MSLGDCLLYLDHHEMEQSCWNTAIDHYMRASVENPDITTEEATRNYKADYERALLDQLREAVNGHA